MRVDLKRACAGFAMVLGTVAMAACSSPSATAPATAAPVGANAAPVAATAAPAAPASPAPASASSSSSATTVQVRTDSALGSILTDGSGKTLYHYDADPKGSSTCTGSCAQNWPPLAVSSGSPTGPTQIQSGLATISRSDGTTQVTYQGVPLYHYSGDAQASDTKGDGVGGVWHVVHP